MLVIVSDFIGLKSGWQDILKVNAQRFDIMAFMIRDPADTILPKAKKGVTLKDPFSDKKIRLQGEKIKEQYEKYVKQHEKSIADFFTGLGANFLRLDTSKSFVGPVIRLFNERKKVAKWK